MRKVTLTINGVETTVPENYTVMRAAEELGITVPRLCFLKDINETSSCRLCVVDVKNMRGLKNSCTLAIEDGMEVETNTPEIHDSIVQNLQLLASNHVFECWACERENNCELLDLMRRYGVENVYGESNFFGKKERFINDSSDSIVLDSGKCILCGRCVTACEKHTGLGILDFNERGNETYVGPALFHSMEDSGCINCGKCITACPVAAIKENSHIDDVFDALRDPNKTVVIAPDPLTFVTLGEDFGEELGTNVEGKFYASLAKLGFHEIFNMNYAEDLSLLETAMDLNNRLQTNGVFPVVTSKVAGVVDYVELYDHKYLPNITSAKSPQQVAGAVIKHHYAKALGVNKEDVVVVTLRPDIASKHEANKEELTYQGVKDVDFVLTVREYARMLKRRNINLMRLADQEAFGELYKLTSKEASYVSSTSNLEKALHTLSTMLEETPEELTFTTPKGMAGFKEATYHVNGKELHVAVVDGIKQIKDFFSTLKKSKKEFHFIEFVSTIDGGGLPIHTASIQDNVNLDQEHLTALATWKETKGTRTSLLNQNVMALYSDWLKEPGSELAQEVLHTTYKAKSFYDN